MAKMKVQAQALQPGDKVGSGEKVLDVYQTVMTPSGKINLTLQGTTKDANGQFLDNYKRFAQWNKHTMINVERE